MLLSFVVTAFLTSLLSAAVTREELAEAEQFALLFVDGRSDARRYFSPNLDRSFTPEEVSAVREGLLRTGGEVRHVRAAFAAGTPGDAGVEQAVVPLVFERGTVWLILRWRGELGPGALAEVFVAPQRRKQPEALQPYPLVFQDAPYVDRSKFLELPREVPTSLGYPAPAHLVLPATASTTLAPAVLLLPSPLADDADGHVGPNRLWQDVAHGLGSQGIASLRFVPRLGLISPHSPPAGGIEELLLEDAAAAVRLLAAQPGVDKRQIYIVGHDLSAYLAPELAKAFPPVRGVFLLAPPARFDPELALAREVGWREAVGVKEPIEPLRIAARQLAENQFDPAEEFLGAPAQFWYSIRSVRPVQTVVQDNKRPYWVLLPAGLPDSERRSAEAWRKLAERSTHIHPVELSRTNFWLLPASEKTGPLDYQQPGHVTRETLAAMLGAIAEQRRLLLRAGRKEPAGAPGRRHVP